MINAIISVIFELNISLFSSINDISNKKVTRKQKNVFEQCPNTKNLPQKEQRQLI